MSKHEFYADPTVFDQWQSSAGHWLCAQGSKVCPFGWAVTFAGLGAVLVLVSITVLGMSVYDTVWRLAPVWNQSLAQGLVAVIALAAAQSLFRQALDAWPKAVMIPRPLRRAARYVGWLPARPALRKPAGGQSAERDAIQAFFSGVRDAGVNVGIARALFAAGIRSPSQLQNTSDRQLKAIRGVGPATVCRLRARFGATR